MKLVRNLTFSANNMNSGNPSQSKDSTVYKYPFVFFSRLIYKIQNPNLSDPFTTLSVHVAMDTSVQVVRHQYLAWFSSSQRQASNDKRNSIASKDNGVQNQNCNTA